jgi:hypothetical protein
MRPSALKACPEFPDIVAWARTARPASGRAFIAHMRTCQTARPAIDDAAAVGCVSAPKAASVCGVGDPKGREVSRQQHCRAKGPHSSPSVAGLAVRAAACEVDHSECRVCRMDGAQVYVRTPTLVRCAHDPGSKLVPRNDTRTYGRSIRI